MGLGLIVGPALGGYLAQPTEKYPQIFSKDCVFSRFPYFLTLSSYIDIRCLVLIGCTWLPETIHKHKFPENDTKIVEALSPVDGGNWDSPCKKNLLQNRSWMSTMIPYCLFGLHETAYSEAASIPVLATFPFMTYLYGVKLSVALYSVAMLKSALSITAITGICLLQNNAVCQEQRGTANGISTTAMSFSKQLLRLGQGPCDQVVFMMLNLIQFLALISTFEPFLWLPGSPK
ncbi:hypothetical protein EJB05_55006 [Eragrostis curvula]|uniref:Major facilitator superfamily (MFS) profile domain-containing protein n=1 Tax=Eragrostis curvula TaxID=38414 RepID=A0A5J9SKQ4_9POAL|nr:hypothetical protein EJB05_55006 [Eragrostis curvula]